MPKTFASKSDWRRYAAYVHIHGVPHHQTSVVYNDNGTVTVKPKTKYKVVACRVCGKSYKKDVRIRGNACPTCVPAMLMTVASRKRQRARRRSARKIMESM